MRRLLILMAISCIWMFTVASSPVVTGAKVRLKAKKYEETIELLEENKDKYPDDPELFFYLGQAYAGVAQWENAGENFSRALELNPDKDMKKEIDKFRNYYWTQFVKDAQTLLDQKRYAAAINKYEIANKINSDRKESWFNLGVAQLELGQELESAEPPKPDSAKILYAEAIESMERAVELEPDDEQFVKTLGQAHIIAGNMDDAIEIYEAHLDEYPDDTDAMKRLVAIYMSNQDFENAAEMYDMLFEDAGVEMSMADYFNAGSTYYQLYLTYSRQEGAEAEEQASDYLTKAAEAFQVVFDDNPSDCESGEQLYYIYINQDKWDNVVDVIQKMLDNGCERSYVTLNNLSIAHSKVGNKEKAMEIYKEAKEKKPEGEQ